MPAHEMPRLSSTPPPSPNWPPSPTSGNWRKRGISGARICLLGRRVGAEKYSPQADSTTEWPKIGVARTSTEKEETARWDTRCVKSDIVPPAEYMEDFLLRAPASSE